MARTKAHEELQRRRQLLIEAGCQPPEVAKFRGGRFQRVWFVPRTLCLDLLDAPKGSISSIATGRAASFDEAWELLQQFNERKRSNADAHD